MRDPPAAARWRRLSVFCRTSQKPARVLTRASASTRGAPSLEPAAEFLDKKVALALWDWQFLRWVTSHPQGYLLNNFCRLHQVEKQLPSSCFVLFGVFRRCSDFFFFFLQCLVLRNPAPLQRGSSLLLWNAASTSSCLTPPSLDPSTNQLRAAFGYNGLLCKEGVWLWGWPLWAVVRFGRVEDAVPWGGDSCAGVSTGVL